MPKLDLEARVTIKELKRRGWSRCGIARALGVTEGTVRYHLRRFEEQAIDGRSRQQHKAAAWDEAIAAWVERKSNTGLNLVALHEHLVEEHDYDGSLRSVQRYVRARFPKPKKRARRRVETVPGAQGQVDWAEFGGVLVGGQRKDLSALQVRLSFSRKDAIVWSERKDQLSWHHTHNEALRRIEGVPATLRVDNVRTAIAQGAGAWGQINTAYRRYAEAVRFHIDACEARCPEAKGKVERSIRDHRWHWDPRDRHWSDVAEIQDWTDEGVERSEHRRICPATGTLVWEAWQMEKEFLAPLPILLPEPFDVVVHRKVRHDCTLQFEGRTYSVPFRLIGRSVEVRGCATTVQVFADGGVVASHPRHTSSRIVLDPTHYEGEATDEVLPPIPLGKMGRRLQEIAEMPPEVRPLDLYAALAEVAR